MPGQNQDLGAILRGRVLRIRGSASPIPVQTLPGARPRAVRRILAVLAALAWHGAMGALGLPESCPLACQDEKLKITHILVFMPQCVGSLPASWFWVGDFG